MPIAQAIDQLAAARETIWGHFDLEEQGYLLFDYRDYYWHVFREDEVCLWENPITDPEDDDFDDAEEGGDIYGSNVTKGDFTLIVVNCNGAKQAWLLANARRVEALPR